MSIAPSNKITRPFSRSGAFLRKWIVPILAALLLIAAMTSLFLSLRETVWCYFSDGISIREDALTANVRMVLFEEPYQTMGAFNLPTTGHNANFTPDEASIVFSGLTGGHTNAAGGTSATNNDLYTSAWDGREWMDPLPISGVNTTSNETGGVVSPSGRYLYFVSDRPGGYGGTDIWIAKWETNIWGSVTNAGPSINSRYDESDPAFAPGGKTFYFSSNRPLTDEEIKARSSTFGKASPDAGFDIFSAGIQEPDIASATNSMLAATNSVPSASNALAVVTAPSRLTHQFSGTARVEALNSVADDRHVSFTPRGDFVYLASSRGGGLGGLDIYRSRILGGTIYPPMNLGLEINSEADDFAPSVRMEGFDLLFSSNRGMQGNAVYMLWSATAREVVPRMDYSRIENLIASILGVIWWIVAIVIVIPIIIYLIRHYKDLTNLFHKCLMASAIIHLALVLLIATWKVASKIAESDQGAPKKGGDISINITALAREKLTVEISDGTVKLPPSEVTVVAKQAEDYVPLPDFVPQLKTPLQTVVARSTLEAVLFENAPSAPRVASTTPDVTRPPAAQPKPEAMPAIEVPEVALTMETRTGDTAPQPGKPTENFVPVLNVPGVSEVKIEYAGTGSVGIASSPTIPGNLQLSKNTASVIGATRAVGGGDSGIAVPDTGGSVVRISRGDDVSAGPSSLSGPGDIVSLHLASLGKDGRLSSELPGQLDVPEGFGTGVSAYMMRKGGRPSVEQVEGLGGSGTTEGSVGRALDWFSTHQEEDGRWAIQKHGGEAGHDSAASGFAILCYLGWGIKHNEAGKYQTSAAKGIDWLMKQVKPDGDVRGVGGNMYDQGIATIALSEAYALTQDPALYVCASNAVSFIVRAQNASTGGWRYQPNDAGDTSVFGWQAMALVSADMAKIPVPKESFEMAKKWLSSVGGGDKGGLYGYTDKNPSKGMTAEGMFCRQILGSSPDEPKMMESAGSLRIQLPDAGSKDLYYWYYGTLAMYQQGGTGWEDWNRSLKAVLPGMQVQEGPDAGAWLPGGIVLGERMGKVVATALATLSLEVYYRYLPFSFTKGLQPAHSAAAAAKTNAPASLPKKAKGR